MRKKTLLVAAILSLGVAACGGAEADRDATASKAEPAAAAAEPELSPEEAMIAEAEGRADEVDMPEEAATPEPAE